MNLHTFEFEELPEWVRNDDMFNNDRRSFDQYKTLAPAVLDFDKVLGNFVYVNCWHMNEHESAAMWKLYVKGDEGVAIRSTVQQLKDSLLLQQDFTISEVSYLDYEKDFMSRVGPLISKRKSFEHEREMRVMVFDHQATSDWIKQGGGDVSVPSGIYVRAELDSLIHRISVSPSAEPWFAELVTSVCSKYGLRKPVETSPLAARPLY